LGRNGSPGSLKENFLGGTEEGGERQNNKKGEALRTKQ